MERRFKIVCAFDFVCYDAAIDAVLVSGLASAKDHMLAALALSGEWIRATELRDFMGVESTSSVMRSFQRHEERAPSMIEKRAEGRCNYYRVNRASAQVSVDSRFYDRLEDIVVESGRSRSSRHDVVAGLRAYMGRGRTVVDPPLRSAEERTPGRKPSGKRGGIPGAGQAAGAVDPMALDGVPKRALWTLRLCSLLAARVPLGLAADSSKRLLEARGSGEDEGRVSLRARERDLRMLDLPGLSVEDGEISMDEELQGALRSQMSHADVHACLEYLAKALDERYTGSEDYSMLFERESLMPHVLAVREHARAYAFSGQGLGDLMNDVGLYLLKVGGPEPALSFVEEGHACLAALFGDSHENTAAALNNVGLVHLGRLDHRAAKAVFANAIAAGARFFGGEGAPDFDHPNLSHNFYNLALANRLAGEWPDARANMERALVMLDAREQRDGTDISVAKPLARAVLAEAIVREALQVGREEDVEAARDRALALMASAEAMVRRLAENDWTRARVAEWHACLQAALGNRGEAIRMQRRAIRILRAGPKPNPTALARYRRLLKDYKAMPSSDGVSPRDGDQRASL